MTFFGEEIEDIKHQEPEVVTGLNLVDTIMRNGSEFVGRYFARYDGKNEKVLAFVFVKALYEGEFRCYILDMGFMPSIRYEKISHSSTKGDWKEVAFDQFNAALKETISKVEDAVRIK